MGAGGPGLGRQRGLVEGAEQVRRAPGGGQLEPGEPVVDRTGPRPQVRGQVPARAACHGDGEGPGGRGAIEPAGGRADAVPQRRGPRHRVGLWV